VNTSEISKGASAATAASASAVPNEAGETDAGEKFAEVIRRVLGGPGLQAVIGGAEDLGLIQCNAAPMKVTEPEKEEAPEETEVKTQGAPVQEESDVEEEVETEAKEETKECETPDQVVVTQAPVQQAAEAAVKTVQAVQTETQAETPTEVAVKVDEAVQVETQGAEAVTVANDQKELPAFQLQKNEQVASEVAAHTVQDTDVQQTAAQTPEQLAGTQPVKEAPVKSTAGQHVARPAADAYEALERAIEQAADGGTDLGLGEPQQTPPPTEVKAAPKEKSAEVILAEATLSQGAMARLSEGSSPGQQGAVKVASNGGIEAIGVGNQGNAEKTAAAVKAKAAAGLPAKDQLKVVEQVKELLQKAIQNREGNTLTMRLNPPELGMMTVKVTQRESQVYARIIPESHEVEQALRSKAAEVTNILVAAGLKPDQVLVSIGRERTDAEAFQFQQFMSGSNGGQRQEGGEQQGSRREHGMPGMSMRHNSEELVADLGWVA